MARKRMKRGAPPRPRHARVRMNQDSLMKFIAEHITEFGSPPTYREMVGAMNFLNTTSHAGWYIEGLVADGKLKRGGAGKNRNISIVGMTIQPPPGIYGRQVDTYTKAELLAVIHSAADTLMGLYQGQDKLRHWIYRMRHPVELNNLAEDVVAGIEERRFG